MKTIPRVCPVWIGYFMNTPLRRLQQDPQKILRSYLHPGMKILEIGPALGYFSLPIAEMIKPDGKVYCVDIQREMLEKLEKRAKRKHLAMQLEPILAFPGALNIDDLAGKIDFCLLANVVHEIPGQQSFFIEIAAAMKKNAKALFFEPGWHIGKAAWEQSIVYAEKAGFEINRNIHLRGSKTCELIRR
jgi:ubiquinone/menaquinone biosynthesis C-methylase UbiE